MTAEPLDKFHLDELIAEHEVLFSDYPSDKKEELAFRRVGIRLEALKLLKASREVKPVEHVAWLRFTDGGSWADSRNVRIVICDSDSPGAFKVYRAPPPKSRADVLKEAAEICRSLVAGVGKSGDPFSDGVVFGINGCHDAILAEIGDTNA